MSIPQFMANTGLEIVHPNLSKDGEFVILGELCQIAHIILQPDQKIQCEPGAMVYSSEEAREKVKLGGIGRVMSGEGAFKAIYHNKSAMVGYVGLSAGYPATIIPIDLTPYGCKILCKNDAFLAAIDPTARVMISLINNRSMAAYCFGDIPLYMQLVVATGTVFLAAHGTIMTKNLAPGEEIVVSKNSLVAMTDNVSVTVRRTGGCCVCCISGEGIFNVVLKGPGVVFLSSMPMEKLRNLFPRPAPQKKKPNAGMQAANIVAGAL